MLVRMLAKVNSYVLLMGMLTSQATVEISMEVIKKNKIKIYPPYYQIYQSFSICSM